MTFPLNPVAGEQTVANGKIYIYNPLPSSVTGVWSEEVQVIRDDLVGVQGVWAFYDLSTLLPGVGRIIELAGQTNFDSDSMLMDLVLTKNQDVETTSLLVKYEDIPCKGFIFIADENLEYGNTLYLGVLFYTGANNTFSFRLDVKVAGKDEPATTVSPYKTFPETCITKFGLVNNGTLTSYHDLTNQIGGANVDFIINPQMEKESLILILDGQVLKPKGGNNTYDYEIINSRKVKLGFVPDSSSQLTAMYAEKG